MPASALAAVVAGIPRHADAEVTVECNPDTVTVELLEGYAGAGVNRLSFGVQSMVPHVLANLGRSHDPDNVVRAVAAARAAGITNLNVDLIYGAVGESLDDWKRTLDDMLALEPSHVSAYGLTVEAGTPLASDPTRYPDDDDQAEKYLAATDRLEQAGLRWYEISNWARPGHACRHNRLYWSQGDYLAFGCAAHGHRLGRRWWNVRTPERYIEAVRAGRSPERGHEVLDPATRRLEGLQLDLRTDRGVPAEALDARDLTDLVAPHPDDPARVVLTVAGRLLANEVAMRLV